MFRISSGGICRDSYGYLEAFGFSVRHVKSTKKNHGFVFLDDFCQYINGGPKTRIPKNHKMTCLGWILEILFENPGT